MASKREKLEEQALELDVEFDSSTPDKELQEKIEAVLNGEQVDQHYFRSHIGSLSIQIGDEPKQWEVPQTVRFTPYQFFDEKKGDHYVVGLLATDEPDAIEVMADDPNVQEITKDEYDQLRNDGKRTKL